MSAEENDGQWRAAHDEAERLYSVHTRHFQVQCDNVRLKLFNLLQRERAIHGGPDDLDVRVARKNNGDQLPHQRGIIHYENADAFAHAIAPSGVARERRERTAGTFKIRTTVPSPRIEAPLTKPLAMSSPGSALITSSSSPTIWSTSKPKRRSAAPMTITNFFFSFFVSSTAWIRLSLFRRTGERIWSRRRRPSSWSTRWISCVE